MNKLNKNPQKKTRDLYGFKGKNQQTRLQESTGDPTNTVTISLTTSTHL